MYFYKILNDIMDKQNLSIADIAKLSGVPDSTLRSAINRKQDTIALEIAFKLSSALGVSLEYLNGDTMGDCNEKASAESQELSNNDLTMENKMTAPMLGLSNQESDFILNYRKLMPHEQSALFAIVSRAASAISPEQSEESRRAREAHEEEVAKQYIIGRFGSQEDTRGAAGE